MPTYVYECAKCGDEFELYQSFSEDPLKKHPDCGGKVAKVFQPVGIVLKGSGFYKNDSRSGAKQRQGQPTPVEVVDASSNVRVEVRRLEVRQLEVGVEVRTRLGRRRSPTRLVVVESSKKKSRVVDAGAQVVVVSAALPASFPLPVPRLRRAGRPGKDPSCPDALPARSRSGAPRSWSRW